MKRTAFIVVVCFLAGCAGRSEETGADGTWAGTITTEGDVTTVVNESGSVWGGTATLVEEASIGVDAGDDPAGEHSGEVSLRGANEIPRIRGGARALIGLFDPRDGNLYGGPSPWSVARLSLSDGAVDHLVELEYVGLPMVERTRSDGIPAFWPVELPVPHPQASMSTDDQIYVAPGDEYQLVAYDANGPMRWALRIAYDAPPLTETMINAETDRLRQHFPDLEASEIPRPEALAAVTGLAVDGHGHIYVFPNLGRIEDLDSVSVDVYSREGDRLFAGFIAIDGWLGAHGDDVFRIEESEGTGGREVVRYTLGEPF
jgi:hypothetical protein